MSGEAEAHRFVVCVPADALATLCDAYVALTGGSYERAADQAPGPGSRRSSPSAHLLVRAGITLLTADDAYDTLTAALPTEPT